MPDTRNRSLGEEWLPSRFNLAIFRMLGIVVAARLQQRPSTAAILYHDREQHPLEAFVLSCALVAIPAVHLFAAIASRLRWPWLTGPLVIIALPFAITMAWDLVVFSVALAAFVAHKLTGLRVSAISLQDPVIHSLMIALSVSSIAFEWRTNWLGMAWMALVALNALCSIALRGGRRRVEGFVRAVTQGS